MSDAAIIWVEPCHRLGYKAIIIVTREGSDKEWGDAVDLRDFVGQHWSLTRAGVLRSINKRIDRYNQREAERFNREERGTAHPIAPTLGRYDAKRR